jgi:hypothetical protein
VFPDLDEIGVIISGHSATRHPRRGVFAPECHDSVGVLVRPKTLQRNHQFGVTDLAGLNRRRGGISHVASMID